MDQIVARARALVGCRYRPQGRDPELGLDCVGVACCAFGIPNGEVPADYRLRSSDVAAALSILEKHFVPSADGELLLLAPAPHQLHLAIATDRGFIHADAGLRRVVETPGVSVWPIIARYRQRELRTD